MSASSRACLAAAALLCAAFGSATGCATAVCKDTWLGPDKAQHFAAGFAVAAASSTLAGHDGWTPQSSAALGLGAAAAAGAAKETYDLKGAGTCWSWKDFAWSMLGGAAGTAVGTVAGH